SHPVLGRQLGVRNALARAPAHLDDEGLGQPGVRVLAAGEPPLEEAELGGVGVVLGAGTPAEILAPTVEVLAVNFIYDVRGGGGRGPVEGPPAALGKVAPRARARVVGERGGAVPAGVGRALEETPRTTVLETPLV